MLGPKGTEEKSRLFEELLAQKEMVFNICLGFSRNPEEAEDLTQDVYLKVYKKMDSMKNCNLLKAWLFRIARNTCLDHIKKNYFSGLRHLFGLESQSKRFNLETPESQTVMKEQLQALKEAVRKLPKKNKEVFIMREYGNLSYQEIAAALRIKEGTVMSRLNRARQFIIKEMKEERHEK